MRRAYAVTVLMAALHRRTTNVERGNFARLKGHFLDAFADGGIDFDVRKSLRGDSAILYFRVIFEPRTSTP